MVPSRSTVGSGGHRRGGAPRALAGAAAVAVLGSVLAACGSDSGGVPTLTWYTNPDSGGQAEIASRCTDDAEGRYRIETSVLPRQAGAPREQLVRPPPADDPPLHTP